MAFLTGTKGVIGPEMTDFGVFCDLIFRREETWEGNQQLTV